MLRVHTDRFFPQIWCFWCRPTVFVPNLVLRVQAFFYFSDIRPLGGSFPISSFFSSSKWPEGVKHIIRSASLCECVSYQFRLFLWNMRSIFAKMVSETRPEGLFRITDLCFIFPFSMFHFTMFSCFPLCKFPFCLSDFLFCFFLHFCMFMFPICSHVYQVFYPTQNLMGTYF